MLQMRLLERVVERWSMLAGMNPDSTHLARMEALRQEIRERLNQMRER
jgi:hypothetical protein